MESSCRCGRTCPTLHDARYLSRVLDKRDRPALQALRIQSFLEKRLNGPTRRRLEKKYGEKALLAQGHLSTKAKRLLD
jgi:hypothetical protein